jgi:hypothetical protein
VISITVNCCRWVILASDEQPCSSDNWEEQMRTLADSELDLVSGGEINNGDYKHCAHGTTSGGGSGTCVRRVR